MHTRACSAPSKNNPAIQRASEAWRKWGRSARNFCRFGKDEEEGLEDGAEGDDQEVDLINMDE